MACYLMAASHYLNQVVWCHILGQLIPNCLWQHRPIFKHNSVACLNNTTELIQTHLFVPGDYIFLTIKERKLQKLRPSVGNIWLTCTDIKSNYTSMICQLIVMWWFNAKNKLWAIQNLFTFYAVSPYYLVILSINCQDRNSMFHLWELVMVCLSDFSVWIFSKFVYIILCMILCYIGQCYIYPWYEF